VFVIFDAASNQTGQAFHSDTISQETLSYSVRLKYSFDQSPRLSDISDVPLRPVHTMRNESKSRLFTDFSACLRFGFICSINYIVYSLVKSMLAFAFNL